MEEVRPVKAIEVVRLYCDECGKEMKRDDIVMVSIPPYYSYHCENPDCSCYNHRIYSQTLYPLLRGISQI